MIASDRLNWYISQRILLCSWNLIFGPNYSKLQIQFGSGWMMACQEMGIICWHVERQHLTVSYSNLKSQQFTVETKFAIFWCAGMVCFILGWIHILLKSYFFEETILALANWQRFKCASINCVWYNDHRASNNSIQPNNYSIKNTGQGFVPPGGL